ncbi:MAG: hypothetical protein N2315_06595 [Thermanaerothrix sp.]|nr:hypothetical protein [Thermanaerothrix sp.]
MKFNAAKVLIPLMGLILGLFEPRLALGVAMPPMDYEGYMIYKGPNGAMSYRAYISSAGMRIEGAGTIQISRTDLGVLWTLKTSERTYEERPLESAMPYFSPEGVPGTTQEAYSGEELVGGLRCSKSFITRTVGGVREDLIRWTDQKTGVTVKVADRYGRWSMEIKNPKLRMLPKGLFEIPKGYVKKGS